MTHIGNVYLQTHRDGTRINDDMDEKSYPFDWVVVEERAKGSECLIVPLDDCVDFVRHFDLLLPLEVPTSRVARCGHPVWVRLTWLETQQSLPITLDQEYTDAIRARCYGDNGSDSDSDDVSQSDYQEWLDIVRWCSDSIEKEQT